MVVEEEEEEEEEKERIFDIRIPNLSLAGRSRWYRTMYPNGSRCDRRCRTIGMGWDGWNGMV